MLGNWATDRLNMLIAPTITMTMEITMATMGRLMKNFDIEFTFPSFPRQMAWGSPARLDVPSAHPRQPRVRPASVRPRQSTGRRPGRPPLPFGYSPCSRRPAPRLDSRLAAPRLHAEVQARRPAGLGRPRELCHTRRGAEYFQDSEKARRSELRPCSD